MLVGVFLTMYIEKRLDDFASKLLVVKEDVRLLRQELNYHKIDTARRFEEIREELRDFRLDNFSLESFRFFARTNKYLKMLEEVKKHV